MKFLITNIRNKDLVLGYPWLATYKPTINWAHAVIHENMMPIVLHTISPTAEHAVIGQAYTEDEKEDIIQDLEEECQLRTTATELAIEAHKDTPIAELPACYQQFAKLF